MKTGIIWSRSTGSGKGKSPISGVEKAQSEA
jgi:hypothetical protein